MMSTQPSSFVQLGRVEIFVHAGRIDGDITRCGAEVLVSSAGTDGSMQSGVSAAIRVTGGDEIAAQLQKHKPLIPGTVVVTDAGKLAGAKYIYHAVIVGWGQERRVLQADVWRAVTTCMDIARLTGMSSIAFPSLGTLHGGADKFETHSTMAAACLQALGQGSRLRQVHFCFNYPPTAEVFKRAFLQQQLMRNIQALEKGQWHDQQLETDLAKLWPLLTDVRFGLRHLKELVSTLERTPNAQEARTLIHDVSNSIVVIGDRNTVQSGKYSIKIDKASGLAIGDGARVERSGDDVER
ncbi:MAG: macro domain-containing protein [Anaerolineae bacterium]|nr:macro domain-containing protein [Anaerolineae bacterium]